MKIGISGPIDTSSLIEFLDLKNSSYPKGLNTVSVTNLIIGFIKAGHHVSVYTLDPDIQNDEILEGQYLKIYFGKYRQRARDRALTFFGEESSYIKKFISEDKPDIVNAHWTYEFALGALRSGVQTIITVRDWAPAILKIMPDPYRFLRLILNYYVVIKGNNFIPISPYIKTKIDRVKNANYKIIPNGFNDNIFSNESKNLNLDEPKIISINDGFGRIKNVECLLIAFNKLLKRIPSANLYLIGDEFDSNGIAQQWAKEKGLIDKVFFLGSLSNKETLLKLQEMDLLIHPSIEESFGNTLVEAMAKKVPVIAGKTSGAVPYVLDYGRAGILTDVASPDSIEEEAFSILTDKGKWDDYSIKGYNHAFNNFRMSIVVQRHLDIFSELLKTKYR